MEGRSIPNSLENLSMLMWGSVIRLLSYSLMVDRVEPDTVGKIPNSKSQIPDRYNIAPETLNLKLPTVHCNLVIGLFVNG